MSDLLPVESIIKSSEENDYSGSPFLGIEDDIGTSLVCHAAMGRNLQVKRHRRMIYEIYDGQYNVVFRQNSPGNSAVHTYCARQKHIAKTILSRAGVPVPSGDIFNDYKAALSYFIECKTDVTVKPSDGSSGVGVSCGIRTEEEFAIAWDVARKSSRKIIVEQNITGQDVRVIVIGGKAEAAYVRTPAHVIGDGKHTISQLVELKNEIRKRNPSLRLDLLRRFDLLERRGISLDLVPKAGEKVQLTSVANTSAGGETVQVLDYLDRATLEIAERAALCFRGLVQVGVDLIYVGQSADEGQPSAYVIEVNSNPGICDAVFPAYGPAVDVPDKLISHVFSADREASAQKLKIALASPYSYADFPRAFYQGQRRQVDLIMQAAYAKNLEVDTIDDSVFTLRQGQQSCMFHNAMPEGVRMVTRKITRNRDWLDEVLPRSANWNSENGRASRGKKAKASRLRLYRLFIAGDNLVAALHLKQEAGRAGKRSSVVRVDVSDLIHPSLIGVLEQTLRIIFNPFIAGVDIRMEDITRDVESQQWLVEDAVSNPFLAWHHFPDMGTPRDVAGSILSALFPVHDGESSPVCARRLLISGAVQQVGFQRWLKTMAIRHAVKGWVKSLADGRLEAVLEGSERSVERLCELCRTESGKAHEQGVEVESVAPFCRAEFTALG